MSALSVPANFLSPQAKPPAQSSNSQPEADTPFAAVLQKKVQTNDSKDAKPAENASQAPAADGSQEQATTGEASAEAQAATVPAPSDNAQTALQQLLPWLQGMQNQGSKTEASKAQNGDAALLPQADTPTVIGLPVTPAVDNRPSILPKETTAETAELTADVLKNNAEGASRTANLAAPTEALTGSAKQQKPEHENFDAALQEAGDKLNGQAVQTAGNTSTTRSSEPARLQAPVGTPQWQNELGDHVRLMSRQNESRAELVLTPPQLGRIEISLNINGDQANAMFVSANPEVRAALEGAMDRLREVLANNGIALGQAQVGSESSGQFAQNESGGGRQGGSATGSAGADVVAPAAWTRHSNNMLDVFA